VRQGEHLRLARLANDLNTSLTPVREALVSLRHQGFVYLEPQRGYFVAPFTREDVLDLYAVQADVAGELAARAAARATPDDVVRIAGAHRDFEAAHARGDDDRAEDLDFQFHRAVNLAAASPKLAWLVSTVVPYESRAQLLEGKRVSALVFHPPIVEALRRRSAEDSRRAMRTHILEGGELAVADLVRKGILDGAGDGQCAGAGGAPYSRDAPS
jgi:DNA-binding GntR family transcriptional regulator